MGWINSFGYTILSYIDYNKYFRTINLGNYIEDFDNNYDFDGIYVKEDQNEIILLRNEKNNISLLSIIDTLYLLPYTMKNSPPSDKQKYIEDYKEYVTQYKTIYEKYTQIKNKYDLIYKKRNRLEKPSEEENILKTNTVQFYIECSEAKIKFLEHIYKLIYINDNNESIYDSMFLIDFIQNEEETFDTFNLSKSKNKYILDLSKHFLDIINNKGDYDEYVVKGAMQANTDEHYTLYKPTNPSIKSFKLALINTHMKDIFKQYIEFIKVTNYYTIYPNEKGSNFKQKYIKYKNKYIKLKSFLL